MGSRRAIRCAISPFGKVNGSRDMGQTLKLKIVWVCSKPTLLLFIGMFVGVVVREKVVVPPVRIIRIYGALYEVIWLWRYSDTNMDPQHENFPTHTEFFFSHDPLRIHSSVRKCNKKFLALGLWTVRRRGGRQGGGCVCMCNYTT